MILTPFYGKNLCNLLSNKVIEYFNSIDKNHKTNISVTDFNNFVVLKGSTSITISVNFSSIFSDYIDTISTINRKFNVIDLIEYNTPFNNDTDLITLSLSKEEIGTNIYDYTDTKNQGYMIFNHPLSKILTNIENINLKDEYLNYNIKTLKDTSNYFVSDNFFGSSLNKSKIYTVLLHYITYHIFESNLCQEVKLKLYFDNESLDLDISCYKCIVSTKWLKSLILDIFDFETDKIKKHLSLDNYNFENEIISNDKCWKKLDKKSEFILL